MKFKCVRCKTKLDYESFSNLVGKLMAHNQMSHGIPPDVWFFKIFGVDPWEIGMEVR